MAVLTCTQHGAQATDSQLHQLAVSNATAIYILDSKTASCRIDPARRLPCTVSIRTSPSKRATKHQATSSVVVQRQLATDALPDELQASINRPPVCVFWQDCDGQLVHYVLKPDDSRMSTLMDQCQRDSAANHIQRSCAAKGSAAADATGRYMHDLSYCNICVSSWPVSCNSEICALGNAEAALLLDLSTACAYFLIEVSCSCRYCWQKARTTVCTATCTFSRRQVQYLAVHLSCCHGSQHT